MYNGTVHSDEIISQRSHNIYSLFCYSDPATLSVCDYTAVLSVERDKACELQQCTNKPLNRCSRCTLIVCFKHATDASHFFEDYSA